MVDVNRGGGWPYTAMRCNFDYMSTSETEQLRGWFSGRLPDDWFEDAPEVVLDREEVSVVGRLPVPAAAAEVSDAERAGLIAGHVQRFRDDTRDRRIAIAREAERRFGHKVSWGVECGGEREMFTTLSVPVMTRLRQPERQVLDTLVEAGVARSRADALGWCVRLVGEHTEDWLEQLREAMTSVQRLRSEGPGL
jgi:hypothetical protein